MEMTIASVLCLIVVLFVFRKPIFGLFRFISTISEPAAFTSAEIIKSNCGKQLLKAQKQNHATVTEAKTAKFMTGDKMLETFGITTTD